MIDVPDLNDAIRIAAQFPAAKFGSIEVRPMKELMAAIFGGGDSAGETIGMDTLGFMLDMPLLGVLDFQESRLPVSAEEMVEGLLAQVRAQT